MYTAIPVEAESAFLRLSIAAELDMGRLEGFTPAPHLHWATQGKDRKIPARHASSPRIAGALETNSKAKTQKKL
jgi:hypothetical protein